MIHLTLNKQATALFSSTDAYIPKHQSTSSMLKNSTSDKSVTMT